MTADGRHGRTEHPTAETLTGYHDGELDAAETAGVARHLESCPDCTARLADLVRIDDLASVLSEEIPAGDFRPGREERILRRLAEEGSGNVEDAPVPEVVPLRPGPGRLERMFGRRRFAWTVATAAALGFVILASRDLLHNAPFEPAMERPEPLTAPESREAGTARQAPMDRAESAPPPSLAKSTAEDEGAPSIESSPEPVEDLSLQSKKAPAPVPSAEPKSVVASREPVAPLEETAAANEAPANEPAPRTGAVLEEAPPASMKSEPAAPEPLPVTGAAREAETAPPPAGEKPARQDLGESIESPPVGVSTEDPETWLAEANERLQPDSKARAFGVAPQGNDAQSRITEAGSRFAREKSPFRDFRIVYATAFRAMEAGDYDLAARGFDIVSARVPASDLARDADVQGRLARLRGRLAGGASRADVLDEAARLADDAWSRSQVDPGTESGRRALAAEKARVTLLREFRPDADVAPFEERIGFLARCS